MDDADHSKRMAVDPHGAEDGVWEKDVEMAFQEAIKIYPACGRKKIVDVSQGKMYGRNELIARFIKAQTGKDRTRKQVSSHIQVLARQKLKGLDTKARDEGVDPKIVNVVRSLSSAQIVSSENDDVMWTRLRNSITPQMDGAVPRKMDGKVMAFFLAELSAFWEKHSRNTDTYHQHSFVHVGPSINYKMPMEEININQIMDKFPDVEEQCKSGRTNAFYLVKCWADLNCDMPRHGGHEGFYGLSFKYFADDAYKIRCSTKVYSFGQQVVEKLQTEDEPVKENNGFAYYFNRSPMCDYMVRFIDKLKDLQNTEKMNCVLENFSVLQQISNAETQELLFSIGFVFEVSTNDNGAQHSMYKLTTSR